MNLSSSFYYSQQHPHAAAAVAMKNRAAYLEQQLRLGELSTNPYYLSNHMGAGSSMPLSWLQQQQLRQEQLLFPSSGSLQKGDNNFSNFHKTMIPKKQEEEDEDELLARFGVNGRKKAVPFPVKLLKVLSQKKYAHIVGWMPNGKSFVILRPKAFCNEILPQHFKSAQYASFTRKLTRWGFTRCDDGTSEFYHPQFRRGRMDLAEKLTPSSMATSNGAVKKQQDQEQQNTDIKTPGADEQVKSEDHEEEEEEEPTTEEDDPSSTAEAPVEEAPETRDGEEDKSSAPRMSPTPNLTTSHSTSEEAVDETPSSPPKKSSSSKRKRKRNSHIPPSSPSQFIKQAKNKVSTPLEMSLMDLPSSAVTGSNTAARLQAIELEAMRLRQNIRAATLARQSFVGNNLPPMRMMPGSSSMMMMDAGGFSRFGGGGAMSMIPPSNSSMMMMMGGGHPSSVIS